MSTLIGKNWNILWHEFLNLPHGQKVQFETYYYCLFGEGQKGRSEMPINRVLLSGDDENKMTELQSIMKNIGFQAFCVHHSSIADAVEERPYRIVFIEADSLALEVLSSKIRLVKSNAHQPAIIGFISNYNQDHVARCMDAGMDDVIEIPIQFDALYEAVSLVHRTCSKACCNSSGSRSSDAFSEGDAVYLKFKGAGVLNFEFPSENSTQVSDTFSKSHETVTKEFSPTESKRKYGVAESTNFISHSSWKKHEQELVDIWEMSLKI